MSKREGVQIILSGVNPTVHRTLEQARFYDLIGKKISAATSTWRSNRPGGTRRTASGKKITETALAKPFATDNPLRTRNRNRQEQKKRRGFRIYFTFIGQLKRMFSIF
ncbi:MAG: hypothetical protein ACLUEV_00415 [Alistipes sp.]